MSTTPPSASPEQQQASSPSQHDSSLLSQSQLSLADDSALQLADVEKHPKGKRKRTAYVFFFLLFLCINISVKEARM
jgi:hypothetical protein